MKLILSILMLLSMNLYSESFAKLKMSCDIGNKHSCFDVGLAYFEGNGVEQDYDKAEKLFDNACERGNIVACHTLGDMHQENKDYQKARDSYEKACTGGDICGCDALKHVDSTISRKKKEISDKKAGIVYFGGSTIKFFDQTKASKLCKACNDSGQIEACYELAMMNHGIRGGGHEEKAMKLFAKICDAGEVKGCFYLGKSYDRGTGVKRNRSKAISIYDDTCKRGYMKGCRVLGEMFLYLQDRTEQESATTLQSLTKACDGEDMEGCNLLGEMYSDGKIVEKNSEKAMELYAKACAGGENLACSNYEHQKKKELEKEKDANKLYEKAKSLSSDGSKNQIVIELYKEACKLEHAESCYMSGVLNDYWNPENLYLQKACELNHAKSCAHLGASNFSMEKGNTQKAIFYTKKACDEGDSESCGLLARMYKNGFKVKKSMTQAKIYQKRTEEIMLSNCHKGEGDACKNLGDIYNPDSVLSTHKSDPVYAIKLYKKGCELEDKGSCGALGDIYYDGKYASADDKTVLSLYEKSCGYLGLTNDYRCLEAGKIAYLQKDYKKTVKYFEQYCRPQSHDTECSFMLGSMYLKGEGVEPNINKAKKFLKQSCDIGKKIQNKITEDVKYGCRAYNKLIEEVESKEQEEKLRVKQEQEEKLRVKQEQEEKLRVQQEQEAIAKGCYYLDGTLNIGTIEGYATTNFRGYDFILDEKYYIATPGRYSTFSKNRKLSLVVKKTGRNREVSLLDLYPYETKQGESEYSKSAVLHKRRYPANKFKTLEVFSLVGTWSEICQ